MCSLDIFKKFFGDRYALFELEVDKPDAFNVGDNVTFYGTNNYFTLANEKDRCQAIFINTQYELDFKQRAQENRLHKFCRIIEKKNNTVTIEMLYGIDVKYDALLTSQENGIAIVDDALAASSVAEFEKNAKDNYQYGINGDKYYLIGKSIHSRDDKGFILVNATDNKYLSVVSKNVLDVLPNDEEAHGDMFVIEKKERSLTNSQNYTFWFSNMDIKFVDATQKTLASELLKSYIESGGERYVSLWQKYADKEYELLENKCSKAGELIFSSLEKLSETKYKFFVKNASSMHEFIKISEESFNGRVLVQQTGKSRLSDIGVGEIVSIWKGAKNETNVLCVEFETEPFLNRNISGKIVLDTRGSKVQYERRKKALTAILTSKANNPSLVFMLNGKLSKINDRRNRIELRSDILNDVFGEKGPNDSQIKAIETALNTPDYAIIQGPPGTGKTRVIRAILRHLQAESSKAQDNGRYLITAYQNDATVNATEGTYDYLLGLPILSSAGKNAEENKRMAMQKWCDETHEKVLSQNPEIEEVLTKRREIARLEALKDRFDDECTTQNACNLLEEALILIDETQSSSKSETISSMEKISHLRNKINSFINMLNKRSSSFKSQLKYYVALIPTGKESFADGGAERLKKVVDFINMGRDGAYKRVFTQQLEVLQELAVKGELQKDDIKTLGKIKIDMAIKLGNLNNLSEDDKKEAQSIIQKCIDAIENLRLQEKQEILYDYLCNMRPGEELYEAVEQYGVTYSATHQKSLEQMNLNKEVDEASSSNYLPLYTDILVDEAARSCPPDLLIPLACCQNRIILVGDDKQLPQFLNEETVKDMELTEQELRELTNLINSHENLKDSDLQSDENLKNAILKVSMFEYLKDQANFLKLQDSNDRVIMLDQQYRMPPVLGNLVSKHFYQNALQNGEKDLNKFAQDYPYIQGKNMLWINVPSTGKTQVKRDYGYCRKAEVDAILCVLWKIRDDFIEKNSKRPVGKKATIGIITQYKAQKELIEDAIFGEGKEEWRELREFIEVGTVDSFQGKEYDIVFFSIVRTDGRFGFLANNHSGAARTCVALSRAKKCMIIVGDKNIVDGTDKKREKAQQEIPAILEFYDACKDNRDKVCAIGEVKW